METPPVLRTLIAALPFAALPLLAQAQVGEAPLDDADHAAEDHAKGEAHAEDEDEDHLAEVEGLRILHAWTHAGSDPTAEIYMEFEHTGEEPVTLESVGAEIAEIGTIVASPISALGGVPETLDGLLLQPGIETALEPGGLYVLLSGVETPREEGDEFEVTLTFERIGEIEVHVEVEAADATQHGHAGHTH